MDNNSHNNTLGMLNVLINQPVNSNFNRSVFDTYTNEEVGVFLSLIELSGAIEINDQGECRIPSDTSFYFLKSICQYLESGQKVINAWDDNASVSNKITERNALSAINLLYLIESGRQKSENKDTIDPIKRETICRVVLKKKSWGKEYVLMQYDSKVRHYQLIGGIKKASDESNIEALKRKLCAELPELSFPQQSSKYSMLYESNLEEEEIILSKKFRVNAQYKTYLYTVEFDEILDKKALIEIDNNKNNCWISFKEIERNQAFDGKDIFKLPPRAIENIKKSKKAVLCNTTSLRDFFKLAIKFIKGIKFFIKAFM